MANSKVKGDETSSLMSAWSSYENYPMWKKVLQSHLHPILKKGTLKFTYIIFKLGITNNESLLVRLYEEEFGFFTLTS